MSNDQTDAFGAAFGGTRIIRAWEPPEEVVIPRSLAMSRELDYDDFGVLIRLLIRDPDQPSSVLGLLTEFRESGWTLSERDLRKIMRRLKKAGHVEHKREYNPQTKRPEWTFRVYRNPANNAAYIRDGVEEASQVRPIGTPCPDRSEGPVSDRDTLSGCAGQADRDTLSGSAPIGTPRPDRKLSNIAGQADRDTLSGSDAPPPLPPGGGKTSSPYPLTEGARPHPEEEEEGVSYETEELDAAADILEGLPDPWIVGAKDAADMAPLLLDSMTKHGWPSILTVNRSALVACLTINPGGMNNPVSVLRHRRIPNLPKYSRVEARLAKDAVRPAESLSAVECDKGCDRGYLELEDGVAPCECLPQRHAASA